MLKTELQKLLDELISKSSKEELIWSSGYLSALALGASVGSLSEIDSSGLVDKLTIIYVTETGNSKFIASELSKSLKDKSVNVKMKASNQYRLNDLAKEKNVIFIISTHGEGEMPEPGKKFWEFVKSEDLKLNNLNYFVVALGDTNYPLFCQAGKDLEDRLNELGANNLGQRMDLDLDFEDHLSDIRNKIFTAFGAQVSASAAVATKSVNKANYEGEILTNVVLNDNGSVKETRHIEIGTDDDIHYEPGDSIGIILLDDEGKKISPRLYSIASSVNETEGEVHLTVSVLKYIDKNGKEQKGLCSNYLASLKEGDKVNFYVSKNRQFKLPAEDRDIIMVGPGTGIAPFRAFMAERNFQNSSGKSWLFFGECNFLKDFLYQTEWQDHLESGLLSKIDVAFSRDQEEKIYVQHKITEQGEEIFNWLENGAYFYVCGDKEKMSKDVEASLLKVIEIKGNKTADEAVNYLEELKNQDRYLLDVY
ncbi:flavodoxin domain-containing protein [Rickettsiales bacterium]|nr:flavodoxin domain-containing protein [Rickettsiales bacterium]